MFSKNLFIGAAVLVALVLCVMGVHAWISEHDARKDAETAAKLAQATMAESQKAIDSRDALLKQQLATLAAQQAAIQTTPQAVKIITQQIPALQSSAAPVVATKSDFTPAEQQALPDAPSYAIFTKDQAIAVAKNELQCQADRDAGATCKQDLADKSVQLKASQDEYAALKKAEKGTFLGNLVHAGKCIALSGGAAALGGYVNKSNPGVGAAIGGSAGALTCALWR